MSQTEPNRDTQTVEEPSDFGDKPEDRVAYWLAQDSAAAKGEKRWIRQGQKIVKRYRDERPATGALADMHRYNVLWSNVQTLEPAIYARAPKADVERRFKDNDPVSRLAAILLERAISWSLDACNFDLSMRHVVKDYLLPGRGTMRVIYCPYYGEPIQDDPNPDDFAEETEKWGAASVVSNDGDEGQESQSPDNPNPETRGSEADESEVPQEQVREVVDEEAKLHYVFWEDYREGQARTWGEVPWIRYRAYMARDELVDRFGPKGKLVNLDAPLAGAEGTRGETSRYIQEKGQLLNGVLKEAEIWEIWDKTKRRVIWLAPGSASLGFLDEVDDPLGLPDFFPSPDPLLATTTTENRVPVPDYIEYQDQASELDILTSRIDRLLRALKVSGVYAGSEKQSLQQLIDEGTENKLIPVEDWGAFTDKGGLQNLIQWMPIKEVAETIIQLYSARDRTLQTLYEITGMSDILRGATSPEETATAQQIKAQFGTLRLNERQRAVSRFARDCIRLVGYVIADQFSKETISRITGYPQLQPVPPPPPGTATMTDMTTGQQVPNPAMQAYMAQVQPIMAQNQQAQQQFEQACELLKSDMPHGFKVDIEADSTIMPDEQADKQARIEFMGTLTPFLQQVVPMAMGNPAATEFAKELTLFLTRGFRTGREMEASIDKFFDAIGQTPPPQTQQPQQQGSAGPDPQVGQAKLMEANTKQQAAEAQNALTAQKNQQQFELGQQKNQITALNNAQTIALKERAQQSKEQFQAVQITHKQATDAASLT